MSTATAPKLASCIQQIYREAPPSKPTVQIIDVKPVANASGEAPTRVKVQISDGEQYGLAVLTGEPAKLVTTNSVQMYSFVVLKNFVVNQLGSTKLAIVMDMSVAETQPAELEKVGEPVKWDTVQVASPVGKANPAGSPVTAGASRTAPSNFSSKPPASAPANYQPHASSPLNAAKATPIEGLNPYSNKWMIKARVVTKSEMRSFSNASGASSVFSFDVCDESSEIRVNAWRDIADRVFPIIEVGKTYLISKGQLKPANKRYSTLNNPYEITLGYDTSLQLVADAEDVKPKIHYRFVPIGDIASRPANAVVDVLGVVTDVSAVSTLNSQRTGRELTKRTMKIADDSGSAIELTLWGSAAATFPDDLADASVVAFKGLRVTEWNQRSLGSGNGSMFEVNPQLEATDRLKTWWEGGGGSVTVSLSQDTRGGGGGAKIDTDARTTTLELADKGNMATSDPEYGTFRGVISKHLCASSQGGEERPMWYSACPKCNKKVIGDETSGHSCENCGWSGAECSYRYILPLLLLDSDGSMIATAFNEQGAAVLGKKADELKRLKDTNPSAFEAFVQGAMWKPTLFRLRAKTETYQQQARLKAAVLSAAPINFVSEGKLLLQDIAKYSLPPADLEAAAVASAPQIPPAAKRHVKAEDDAVKPEPMEEIEPEATGSQPEPDASHFSQFDD